MGDRPGEQEGESPDTSKLELPSLKLPRRRRTRKAAAVTEPEPAQDPAPKAELEPEPEPEREAQPGAEPKASRPPSSLPTLPGWIAALVTGLVVGVFGTLLTYVSLHGCDALKGTESCGGTGLFLLVIILVLMVLLGGVVLAVFKLPEPRSTSFLAVGVLAVVVLLTLVEQLFSAWMFLVVPVIGAASYVLSHWVTTTFIEPRPEKGPEHDVR
jgi:hypothetical protein